MLRGASGRMPNSVPVSMKAAPAAQACGTLAPIYCTGKLVSARSKAGVELRQLVLPEIARGPADVARDPRRLRAESIKFEPHRNDGVVVRPHRPGLVIVRVERRIVRRQRADPPAGP